jgi:integrase
MALTVRRVERTVKPGRYGDGGGLWLQVVNSRNRSWLFRWERDGRDHTMGLGPVHTVPLELAREKARACRLLLLDGIDPRAHRDAERAARAAAKAKALLFKEAAVTYHAQHEAKWRSRKHAAQFFSTLKTYTFPVLGNMAVADIDTPAVLRAIEPFWLTKTETASRVRGRIEAVLDWCTVRGYRQGDNPARWKGHLSEVLPGRGQIAKPVHHPALPWRDVPGFMAELAQREGTAARALEFGILTVARTGEVIGAQLDEINGDIWTIPAGRMKSGREHRVALSARAVELLRSLPTEAGNRHVFIGPRAGSGLSDVSLTAVLRRMGRRDVTVHGFRSTFMDWAHEQTAFPKVVIDMALAHVVGDKSEAAYRRGDLLTKRRALAEAWAKYCTSPPLAGDVVPLKRKAGGHA